MRLDIIAWEAQMTSPIRILRHRALVWPVAALAGASILLAACGSSSKAATAPPTTAVPAQAASGTSASNASVTLNATAVPGVGTVLVNGDGQTLYILASEKGGKVNCTATGGCTKVWPAVVLPSGMSKGIAGTGVQASLLGTVMGPAGDVRLTYADIRRLIVGLILLGLIFGTGMAAMLVLLPVADLYLRAMIALFVLLLAWLPVEIAVAEQGCDLGGVRHASSTALGAHRN